MKTLVRSLRTCALFATVAWGATTALGAQGVTTAAIAGVVSDSSGAPLDEARVLAVHGPSGTAYAAVTRADGRFTIPGMRVGGPYRVTVALVGYRQEVRDQIQLTLGGTADLRFALALATLELEPVTVTATSNPVFSAERTSVAPVSLDALEQLQVNVAPYDVRQGNFVGAGINMVTKSGTNVVRGSLFYNTRNDNFVGTTAGPNTFNPGSFKYHDIGVALGGPIIRNRLFFFGSYENDGQTAPGTTFLANNGSQRRTGGSE